MSKPIDTSPRYEYETEEVVIEKYETRALKVSLPQQQQVQASVKQEMVSLPQQLAQALGQAVSSEAERLRLQLVMSLVRAKAIADAWLSRYGAEARSPSLVSKYYSYVSRVEELLKRVAEAKTLDELNKLKQEVDALVKEVENLRVDPRTTAQLIASSLSRATQEVKDEGAKKALQQAADTYNYLANTDLSTLRKDVSLFYMLMDLARDDVYKQIYESNRESFQALLRVLTGNTTYSDVEKAFYALTIIKQLKDQGLLNEKNVLDNYRYALIAGKASLSGLQSFVAPGAGLIQALQTLWQTYSGEVDKEVQQRLKEIESKISGGAEPEKKQLPIQLIAEATALINPTRYIYNLAFNGVKSLAKLLGADENTANSIADKVASGVTGASATAIGVLAPPLGMAMALSATLDAVSDIASRLTSPIDRQLFLEYLQNHWQDLLIDTAIGVAASIGAGYATAKIKPAVYNKIADALEKLGAKSLADKVREAVAPTYAVKEKIPSERKWELQVKDDGTVVIQYQEVGKLGKTIAEMKLGKDAAALFKDPATGSKIMEIVGNISDEDTLKSFLNLVDKVSKTYGLDNAKVLIDRISDAIKKGNLRGVALVGEYGGKVLVGDYSTVTIYDVKTGNAIATLPGDHILLLAPRSNPDAFNFFAVLHERGINPVQAYDSMSDVISAVKAGSKINVTYNFGSVKAVLDNGKLYLVDARSNSVLAVVDPTKLSKVDLMAMSSELSRLSQAYGASAAKAVLDIAKAFGSLQTPAIPVFGYVTPETKFTIDLASSLPQAQKATVRSITTDKGVFIVIDQALADRAGNISRLSFAEAETFTRNLLSTTYTDKYVAVFRLAPTILKYVKDAQSLLTGIKSPDELFGFASSLASTAGDYLAAQQLSQIALALKLASQNLLSTPLIVASSDGMIIGVVASSQAVWQALSKASKALAEGRSDEAHDTLVNTLMRYGLSRAQAESLAQSLIEQYIQSRIQAMAKGAEKGAEKPSYAGLASAARNNTLAVMRTLGLESKAGEVAEKVDKALIRGDVDSARNAIIEALAPIYGYTVARLVANEILAASVEGREPRLDKYFYIREETVEAPLVIPTQIYETETRESSATAKDRAVQIPVEKVETVEQIVSVPVATYEAVEQARAEAAKDKAVYTTIEEEESFVLGLAIPQYVYEPVEVPRSEVARDRAVYVPVVKEEPVEVPLAVPQSVFEGVERFSSVTVADKVIYVPIAKEEQVVLPLVLPLTVYEPVEQAVAERVLDRVVYVPLVKEDVVALPLVVPLPVYDVAEELTAMSVADKVLYVPIVKEESLHLPLVLPLQVYEPIELQSNATARDVAVVVPVTLEEKPTSAVVLPVEVYESVEQASSETVKGVVLPVEKEVVVPVEATIPVDVTEAQLIQQPTPAPPSPTSAPLPAPPLPTGGGGVLPGPESRYPPPKGRRELEGVEI